jgi:hypothetical protein
MPPLLQRVKIAFPHHNSIGATPMKEFIQRQVSPPCLRGSRGDKLLEELLPLATARQTSPEDPCPLGDEISFEESLAAANIVVDVIKQRMKLLRYEDVPAINQRKPQADIRRLLGITS